MSANLVFVNGQVITVDSNNRIAQAVAVSANRIVAVGTNDDVKPFIGLNTNVIDLKGKSLLPGFIDSHIHLTLLGTNKRAVNCKAAHIRSIADILKDLKELAAKTPKGEWVRAFGFNESAIAEQRYLTRWELDSVSVDHPILVVRTCAHNSIANSTALARAGITPNTPDPEGGRIVRDANGTPTGVLIETAHMNMFELAKYTDDELRSGMAAASSDLLAAGITSIHDAGGYGADNFRIMQQAVRNREVKVRVYAMVGALNDSPRFVRTMIASGITTGVGDERFRVGPAKIFTDGSSSGPTVATREPYTSNPNDYGILYYSQEEINDIFCEAHEKGFQVTAHAQGDRAIEMVLNGIETALRKHPRPNHRHRIEHAGLSMPDLLSRMKKLGVVPTPNPAFFYEFGDGYVKNYGERVHHMYPARDFIDLGIVAAAGSDSPVTDYHPLHGLQSALLRKSKTGQVVGARQKIGLMEAIRLFTYNGAYASFEENIKGSIEAGKLADLVVLNGDILNTPYESIRDLQSILTVLDGEIVYAAD
jgi:hypothetical protein